MESIGGDLRQMQRQPLHASHVEALRKAGEIVVFEAGELVAAEGDPMDRFIYIVEGEIELVNPYTDERHLPWTLGPTQFVGDISLLLGGVYSMPLRAYQRTETIVVPRDRMLELMSQIPEMSDIVITVYAARRRRILEDGDTGLVLLGADSDRDIRQISAFASRNRIPVHHVDLGTDEANSVAKACGTDPQTPAVIFGKSRLIEPRTPEAVAKVLGLDWSVHGSEFDVLIVGGGPAGVAAGVYAGAEGMKALVVDELAIGGQAGTSSRVENYMGFPTGISGGDLVWRGEVQAIKFGTQFAVPRRVTSLAENEKGFRATLDNAVELNARAVVVATGVQYRRLPIENLEHFEGAGIYYAATETESRYCRNGDVYVVGGGNSAGQAAMYLSRTATHVHLLVRGTSLASSMSEYLSSRLESEPKITIHYQTEIESLRGDHWLEGLRLKDKAHNTHRDVQCCGAFIMVGAAPNTGWLKNIIELDDKGFVLTGERVQKSSPFETSSAGIFAVGDVRAGSVKRVASAVGEGSVVISRVWDFVHNED